ncbi:hypothetical protein AVEN_140693-1 [Araneus ventricosus]|uniref:DNA helicase Pif1-like 2B domain-containing protein n=1 Tax=Araneus ventricosus TaxID=182803 RepID=A0A4Y2C581_ARAVE|nr:hypothetical protein AVEN_140693-1 [Araneus ventricosus]
MPGNEVIYESIDNIVSNDPQDQLAYTEEFLNSLTPTGMPPHKLRLKPGAILMLLRNLAPSKGLCNVAYIIPGDTTSTWMRSCRISKRGLASSGGAMMGWLSYLPLVIACSSYVRVRTVVNGSGLRMFCSLDHMSTQTELPLSCQGILVLLNDRTPPHAPLPDAVHHINR